MLDRRIGGKTVPLRNRQFVFNHTSQDHTTYESKRRAIYLPIIRNNLYPFLSQYDYPDPTMPTGTRSTTTVAPQALLLLNNALILDAAKSWADQLQASNQPAERRIRLAYTQAFGRQPTGRELERCLEFVASQSDPWPLLCQSLIAANEFIYLR